MGWKLNFKIMIALFGIFLISLVSATDFSNTQSFQPSYQTAYAGFSGTYGSDLISYNQFFTQTSLTEKCEARQDFLVNIRPGSCMPLVVRSDLLEQQNVPVFCKLDALKLNPLIDVAVVKSVGFKGKYPDSVQAVSFHPSQAALRIYNPVLDSTLLNDIGYVVVVLKKQQSERTMPESVQVNLTAVIRYDMQNLFGSGQPSYYLPKMSDAEWKENYKQYGFWKGQGYVRAEEIYEDKAVIGIYSSPNQLIRKVSVKIGETSDLVYMPFSYCSAGVQVKLDSLTSEKPSAKLQIDSDEINVIKGQKILNGECSVKDIIASSGGIGKIQLYCRGSLYTLEVGALNSLNFDDGSTIKKIDVGSKLLGENDIGSYLVYTGRLSNNGEETLAGVFVKDIASKYLVNNAVSKEALKNIADNFDGWKSEIKKRVASNLGTTSEKVFLVFMGNNLGEVNNNLANYKLTENKNANEVKYEQGNKIIEDYFGETNKIARDIVELYGSEKTATTYYGAKDLMELAELAKKLNKGETRNKILRDIISKYPDSNEAVQAKKALSEETFYDYKNSYNTIKLGDLEYYFKLISVNRPGITDTGADFEIVTDVADYKNNVGLNKFQEEDYVLLNPEESIQIKEINQNDVRLIVKKKPSKERTAVTTEIVLQQGKSISIGFSDGAGKMGVQTAVLRNIKINKVAQVQVLSNAKNTQSEANFSVQIGIEKRLIQLSPEKTLERIKNLNDSINKWNKTVEKLGNIVSGLKTACFAGAAILMVKNFMEGLGGASVARKKVMDSYWTANCSKETGNAGNAARDACYARYSNEIEKSVQELTKGIEQSNQNMNRLSSGITKTDFFGSEQVDSAALRERLIAKDFSDFVEKNKDTEVVVNGKKTTYGQIFNPENKTREFMIQNINNSGIGVQEMTDIMLYGNLKGSDVTQSIAQNQLSSGLGPVKDSISKNLARTKEADALKNMGLSIEYLNNANLPDRTQTNIVSFDSTKLNNVQNLPSGFSEPNKKYFLWSVPAGTTFKKGNKDVPDQKFSEDTTLLVSGKSNSDSLAVEKAVILVDNQGTYSAGNQIDMSDFNEIKSTLKVGRFSEINKGECNNKYIDPIVRYYDSEPNKNMPSVVPIDTIRGWYAGIKQTSAKLGTSITSYKESGAVSSLWLCNVGKDGVEQWELTNKDDVCIQVNYETGQPLEVNPCISNTNDAKNLALRAKKVVEQAAGLYNKEQICLDSIGTKCFKKKAALKTPDVQCQNFMSPTDCMTLFNLCDPVLCPSSRCDFGGRYPVDDVVQSGIIGSILLCLPNFNINPTQGVLIPVCVSGIQAGLDAYVSILRSHRDCLQENINSGKMTGICDEIYSLYACDFFWKQLAPLVNQIIPRTLELLTTGRQTRGGGEYLTVQESWNNLQGSINYFTSSYAVNSFKAFKARSTTEMISSEVCKGFVSANFPTSSKALDSLLKPDSPVQFHAFFDESSYSEATVPTTSQYKVYYHIYSGKDSGHYYQIYLKNPPETGYYAQSATVVIDSGYVGVGQTVDLTKNILAPTGYRELCVKIDAKEECGFKQVTTSAALDMLKDNYMKEQATEEISTEEACVSGTTSLYSLAQPNLQSGVQEAVNPAIYNRGIIRVCSNANPGESTSPERWKKVGYCDNKNIGCWIDQNSVKKVITDKQLQNLSITEIENLNAKNLFEKGEKMDEKTSQGKINGLIMRWQTVSNSLSIAGIPGEPTKLVGADSEVGQLLGEIENVQKKAYWNKQIVQAYDLKFSVYKVLTAKLGEDYVTRKSGVRLSSDLSFKLNCDNIKQCSDYTARDDCVSDVCNLVNVECSLDEDSNCVENTRSNPANSNQANNNQVINNQASYSINDALNEVEERIQIYSESQGIDSPAEIAVFVRKLISKKIISEDDLTGINTLGELKDLLNKKSATIETRTYKISSVYVNGKAVGQTSDLFNIGKGDNVEITANHYCDAISVTSNDFEQKTDGQNIVFASDILTNQFRSFKINCIKKEGGKETIVGTPIQIELRVIEEDSGSLTGTQTGSSIDECGRYFVKNEDIYYNLSVDKDRKNSAEYTGFFYKKNDVNYDLYYDAPLSLNDVKVGTTSCVGETKFDNEQRDLSKSILTSQIVKIKNCLLYKTIYGTKPANFDVNNYFHLIDKKIYKGCSYTKLYLTQASIIANQSYNIIKDISYWPDSKVGIINNVRGVGSIFYESGETLTDDMSALKTFKFNWTTQSFFKQSSKKVVST
jgi:hypothetical protein